ncbi:MAG: hypothetical protein LBG27_00560 [Spirochaetaceae bacterium]|nr:hypothetical protein [Spirochaetaceae bacterium]
MKMHRQLQQNIWYKVRTEVNIGEPLFKLPMAVVLLHRMLREIKKRYPFEMRGLKLEGARLTFYIKPDDGFKLPLIMQLLKQTFSLRFNIMVGRKGHVWGSGMSRRSWTGSRLSGRKRRTGRRQTSRQTRRQRGRWPAS